MLLLLEEYIQSKKEIRSAVVNSISDTVYQGWIQLYGVLFWIISVFVNHWRLRQVQQNKNIDYDTLFDITTFRQDTIPKINSCNEESKFSLSFQQDQQCKKEKKQKSSKSSSSSSSKSIISPPKSKSSSPPTTSKRTLKKSSSKNNNDANRKKLPPQHQLSCSSNIIEEKKSTKPSLLKGHMLSLKQKLSSNSQPSSPTIPLYSPEDNNNHFPKRNFLRRLSSANNSIYSSDSGIGSSGSNSSSSSIKSEPSSPTSTTTGSSSILKSISLKLKRQESSNSSNDNNVIIEDKPSYSFSIVVESSTSRSRLLLSNFRRKTLPDITLQ